LIPFLPFFGKSIENSVPYFPSPSKYCSAPFHVFSAEILAPWQHCLAGHTVLIGKPMQLEKKDAAKSQIDAA
jgi:hypothetical protein